MFPSQPPVSRKSSEEAARTQVTWETTDVCPPKTERRTGAPASSGPRPTSKTCVSSICVATAAHEWAASGAHSMDMMSPKSRQVDD